jgi:hypothetical protein
MPLASQSQRTSSIRVARQQRSMLQTSEALGHHGIEPQATWVRRGYFETVRARIRWTASLRL